MSVELEQDFAKHIPVRLITAGSVDDGKSTLIGRLLYDCQAVLADQMLNLTHAKHSRVFADDAQIDLALLTDGLSAEREQGITIDVAYRYFATTKRKFILADAPGHEQYTRNMVTGASQSDIAVILVDATRVEKIDGKIKLLPQTKRHSSIIKLLNLHNVIFAVNKMDLLDYSEEKFDDILQGLNKLSNDIGLKNIKVFPISALKGENIVRDSVKMKWYKGGNLLNYLENLPISVENIDEPLRFPVQLVVRSDGDKINDFRGLMGKITSGQVFQGQEVVILPAEMPAKIKNIFKPGINQSVKSAIAGEMVTIEFSDDIDVSRGDLIIAKNSFETDKKLISKKFNANICWLDTEALALSRKYLLKTNTRSSFCKINEIIQVFDIHTLSHNNDIKKIHVNDIGEVNISLQQPIFAENYNNNKSTGSFIIIDPVTSHTVAAGMIK